MTIYDQTVAWGLPFLFAAIIFICVGFLIVDWIRAEEKVKGNTFSIDSTDQNAPNLKDSLELVGKKGVGTKTYNQNIRDPGI